MKNDDSFKFEWLPEMSWEKVLDILLSPIKYGYPRIGCIPIYGSNKLDDCEFNDENTIALYKIIELVINKAMEEKEQQHTADNDKKG